MRKRLDLFTYLATIIALFAMISWSSVLRAQSTRPGSQQPSQTQPPNASNQDQGQQPPNQAQPPQTSDQAPPPDQTGAKIFLGTVVKKGDKYMLQEDSTGTLYDIDHQDEVKNFDGKKVRVHGILDPDKRMIHVQ